MEKEQLLKKGLRLEYATLIWNIFECLIVLTAGITAGSISMIGFGIDSVIEIFASVVVVWQLKSINKNREKFAERLIGVTFILLAGYIFTQSSINFLHHIHPRPSPLGIISLVLTVAAMLSLAVAKGRVGRELNNPVLVRESKVTLVDAMLAFSVLIGVLLNSLFGFWWADSLSGLVLVIYGIKEALEIFKEARL